MQQKWRMPRIFGGLGGMAGAVVSTDQVCLDLCHARAALASSLCQSQWLTWTRGLGLTEAASSPGPVCAIMVEEEMYTVVLTGTSNREKT